MTAYVHRTMILPAQHAPLARALAAFLAGPPGDGMWTTGLSADGTDPATHYVSSGPVAVEFEPVLTDAQAMYDAVQAATASGMESPMTNPDRATTLADCEALVAAAEVVDLGEEGPFDTFARLGLALVSENPDPE